MTQTAIMPANIPPAMTADDALDMITNYPQFARLSSHQRAILSATVSDYILEKPRTQEQMAEDLGISRSTIVKNLSHPGFGMALGMMMVAITRSKTNIYLRELEKTAMESIGHVKIRALELLLKYGGTLTNKLQVDIRSQTVNMSSESASGLDSIDKFLITLGAKGWNKERLCARWDELKSQQAW